MLSDVVLENRRRRVPETRPRRRRAGVCAPRNFSEAPRRRCVDICFCAFIYLFSWSARCALLRSAVFAHAVPLWPHAVMCLFYEHWAHARLPLGPPVPLSLSLSLSLTCTLWLLADPVGDAAPESTAAGAASPVVPGLGGAAAAVGATVAAGAGAGVSYGAGAGAGANGGSGSPSVVGAAAGAGGGVVSGLGGPSPAVATAPMKFKMLVSRASVGPLIGRGGSRITALGASVRRSSCCFSFVLRCLYSLNGFFNGCVWHGHPDRRPRTFEPILGVLPQHGRPCFAHHWRPFVAGRCRQPGRPQHV